MQSSLITVHEVLPEIGGYHDFACKTFSECNVCLCDFAMNVLLPGSYVQLYI